MKTYLANSVLLYWVPPEHRAANGSRQFTILCRTDSQKRVAELVGCSLYDLRQMGIHEAGPVIGFNPPVNVADIVKEDHVVHYSPSRNLWVKYEPKAS